MTVTDGVSDTYSEDFTITVEDEDDAILSVNTNALSAKDISIYPNPTEGQFYVEIKNLIYGELELTIMNINGKQVINPIKITKTGKIHTLLVNLINLPRGIYVINIHRHDYSQTKRFVKL